MWRKMYFVHMIRAQLRQSAPFRTFSCRFLVFNAIFLQSKKYALLIFQFALRLLVDVDMAVGLERTELLPIGDYNGR